MPRQEERNPASLGFVAGVQPGFARKEQIAASGNGGFEQFARAAASDADALDGTLQVANDRQPADFQELLEL
jgi:hypothetical protein